MKNSFPTIFFVDQKLSSKKRDAFITITYYNSMGHKLAILKKCFSNLWLSKVS